MRAAPLPDYVVEDKTEAVDRSMVAYGVVIGGLLFSIGWLAGLITAASFS